MPPAECAASGRGDTAAGAAFSRHFAAKSRPHAGVGLPRAARGVAKLTRQLATSGLSGAAALRNDDTMTRRDDPMTRRIARHDTRHWRVAAGGAGIPRSIGPHDGETMNRSVTTPGCSRGWPAGLEPAPRERRPAAALQRWGRSFLGRPEVLNNAWHGPNYLFAARRR